MFLPLMPAPFFSIIVTSLNAEALIERTILSVLEQTDDDYEIIVKDGGSMDGTLSRIPQHERIKVFSIPDGGIYEGMNQGVERACGRYLYFLNCGDTLHDKHVLRHIHALAVEKGGADDELIIYGDYISGGFRRMLPSPMSRSFLYGSSICHQSMFFGRRVFERYGEYDTTFRLMADYDQTLKAFMGDTPFIHCRRLVCHYLAGGFSAQKAQRRNFRSEFRSLKRKYFSRGENVKYSLYHALMLTRVRAYLKKIRQRLCTPPQGR